VPLVVQLDGRHARRQREPCLVDFSDFFATFGPTWAARPCPKG